MENQIIIVDCVLNDTFAQMSRFAWAFYIAVAGALVADVIFSSTLCVMLAKRRTGIKWTDSIVHTLMLYSISTCAFTTFCEGAVIITYAVWPHDFMYLGPYFIMPKLLLNALLASLNARENLRQRGSILSICRLSLVPASPPNIHTSGEPVEVCLDRHLGKDASTGVQTAMIYPSEFVAV